MLDERFAIQGEKINKCFSNGGLRHIASIPVKAEMLSDGLFAHVER